MLENQGAKKGWLVWIFCLFLLVLMQVGGLEAAGASSEPEHYKIGKGDVLSIVVWQEPELSRDITVRVDGRISLPLVDDVLAAGKTPMELKEVLTRRLKQYISSPEVTIIVSERVGSYFVLGEVAESGEYPLIKDVTVIQALSKAGGFTDWANTRNLVLLREDSVEGETRVSINYNDIVSGRSPELNVPLRDGDSLIVPH